LIELNKFYCADSVEFMQECIPNDFVDLTVTSPPYDNLRKYKGFDFNYKLMLEELYRVSKPGGVLVWVVADATINGSETLTSFKQALYAQEIGFNVHDTMIYQRNSQPRQSNRYEQDFEYMFVFSKGRIKTFNPLKIPCKHAGEITKRSCRDNGKDELKRSSNIISDYKLKGNVWIYNTGKKATKDNIALHPAPFPEKLAEDHILSWTNKEDVILDPMCGTGTTCKMAWLNERRFIGIDMGKEYIYDICIPRLRNYNWDD
jgi:DNA modification methylase